ncbi:MAG: hypothetical protein LAP87_06010 [Acidobacteriia bacterium]|nr:hypothetical protein [Terriglobia bacterium]
MPPVFEGFDGLETLFNGVQPREDLSLCFVCLRWASGDPDCVAGRSCDLQRTLAEV